MERKIGKNLIFLFFMFTHLGLLSADVSVSMRALERETNKEISTVSVGVPFLLEVSVEGALDDTDFPSVDGLRSFNAQRCGTSMSIVAGGGVTTKKRNFVYKIRIDEPGKHTIGPATVEVDDDMYRSDVLQIEASMKSEEELRSNKNVRTPVSVKIGVDKSDVFVGQQLLFTIKVYGMERDVSLDGISQPELKSFSTTPLEGPIKKKEKRGERVVDVLEWRCLAFPKEIGEIIIPAVSMGYQTVEARRRSRGGIWDFMGFGSHSSIVQKQTYSNSIKMDVKKLPEFSSQTDAVGSFRSFSAKMDRKKASEGEGAVFTLSLEGQGNFEMIPPPKLALPSTLKYYESAQDVKKSTTKYADRVKTFSYIVQGVKHGTWEIQPQKFVFFDPDTRSYKTLKTQPIMLAIEPSSSPPKVQSKKYKDKSDKESGRSELSKSLIDIESHGPWYPRSEKKIPWWLFFVVAIPMAIVGVARFLLKKIFAYRNSSEPFRRKKYAFKNAYKQLIKEEKDQNISNLYPIFNKMFADRLMENKVAVTEIRIILLLESCNLDRELINQWQEFYSKLAESLFSQKSLNHVEKKKIFDTAKKWIKLLEKML